MNTLVLEQDIEKKAFNPHWVGKKHCRDYRIGNIILKDVPDRIVKRFTTSMHPTCLLVSNTEEFLRDCIIEISYTPKTVKIKNDKLGW